MSWIPIALQAAGTLMSIKGSRDASKASKSGARAARESAKARQQAKEFEAAQIEKLTEFEAAQLEQNAGQTIAASQRAAAEKRRQALLVQSRALAVAAAGGGGVGENDTSFMNLMANTAGRGAYDSAVALYEGEDRARLMRMQATATRYEGRAKGAARRYEGAMDIEAGDSAADAYKTQASAYRTQAMSSALSLGGSLFAKYGGGGPSGDAALIGEMVPGMYDLTNPAYG